MHVKYRWNTHTLVCTARGNCFCEALWSTVCPCFQLEKTNKQESKPDNTFSGQTKWLVSMGIKFVNTSSTHTHKVPHTHFITTRCHNTSFSAASIKPHWQEPCPLLSNCHAEMFTFTYKWPGVMLCHIMFHGQIMCPISQSALQPLSPLSSLYSHNDTQAPWPQKGNLVSPQWSATLN